jgi:hypothetical protein
VLSLSIFNNRHNAWRSVWGQTCGPRGCRWRCPYQSGRGNDVFPERRNLLQDCKSWLNFQWAMEEEIGGSAHMGLAWQSTLRPLEVLHICTYGLLGPICCYELIFKKTRICGCSMTEA